MTGFLELREKVNGESQILSSKDFKEKFQEQKNKKPKSDWYRSLFVYDKAMTSHFKQNNSVKGYSGPADAGYLFFDLDNSDLLSAKKDTIMLLKKLCEVTGLPKDKLSNHVSLFFSGNKGFHVLLHTEKRFSPEELKETCTLIAGNLNSFDPVIYNRTRIIRIENTIHNKSGLYKIRLKLNQINLSVQEIKKLATSPHKDSFTPIVKFKGNLILPEKPKQQQAVIVTDEIDGIIGLSTIDFSKCPKNVPRCIYAMTKGIMVPGRGERHQIFLALTRYYKNQGFEPAHTHRLLKGVAELNKQLYPTSEVYDKNTIWHECVKSVYEDKDNKFFNKGGWGIDPKKDTIFINYCKKLEPYCNTKCCMHDEKNKTKTVFTASEMLTGYKKDFAKNYKKSIIKTGIKFLDTDLEIRKRTSTLVVGSAGSGKTSLVLKVLENSNKLGITSVFFSMDMDMYSVLEKLGEKHTPYKRKDFREAFRKLEEKEPLTKQEQIMIDEITEAIETHYGNTIFDYSSTLSMDEMNDKVLELEQQLDKKVGLVLVDYASRISSHHKDDYANQKFNALKSKEVAQQTDCAWIYLCQTSRNSGDSHIPLRTKRAAKGAGDWEEAAQNVITIWRPFAGMDGVVVGDDSGGDEVEFKDNVMRAFIAKNRMGAEKEIILKWQPQDGILEEMSEDELYEYKQTIEPLEKRALKYKVGKRFD